MLTYYLLLLTQALGTISCLPLLIVFIIFVLDLALVLWFLSCCLKTRELIYLYIIIMLLLFIVASILTSAVVGFYLIHFLLSYLLALRVTSYCCSVLLLCPVLLLVLFDSLRLPPSYLTNFPAIAFYCHIAAFALLY